MKKWNVIDWISMLLLIVGGLNWGLVGFFGVDLVAALFGPMTGVSRLIYSLVGLSALYVAVMPAFFSREECIPAEPLKTSRT